MAKSTPRSAAKGTPSSASKKAAASPAAAPASSSKKRVRVVEDSTDANENGTPASASKKTRASQLKEDKDAGEDTPSKKGKNGVVLRDLRDKKIDEIETIRSKDTPAPKKGALKKEAAGAKGKGKGKAVEEEEEEVIELEVEGGEDDDDEEADEEEIDFLAGFESGEDGEEGEDSSDEDEDLEDAAEKDKNAEKTKKLLSQLPKVKGGEKAVEKKVAKEEKKAPKTGTVYLGRIPKGFYEEEMRSYFSQFGEVTRLRLSRNKKTGASKHYAFLEFKYASVAQIVQETMDNYLLAGHILVCKVVPDEQVHPKLWVGANRKFRVVPAARKELKRREKPKTDAQKQAVQKRLLSREDKKRAQLAELGIEYDFAGFAGKKVDGAEEEKEEKVAEEKKGTAAKGKKGRKSAGGEEPAKKKPRKSK
ncbi:hypothetical protein JCM6882_004630 [Rhodosporidiobolus microsporus]